MTGTKTTQIKRANSTLLWNSLLVLATLGFFLAALLFPLIAHADPVAPPSVAAAGRGFGIEGTAIEPMRIADAA